ncbi:NUDIX hydrolase [Chlorobium sp. BLA1]|uniref:NUDIX hydrolase n=1 Tax=Candidatus Chlorobium masyuteum TaxID=2716876 RepID=UPI0014246A8E|nr:NUDIX hydrolase [Candidatus Chlorobium masyuteum]NHQ60540.1 NUDIX hydrolase [Candidatus Chlorobium masyuteum]NTU45575.1 NUDIX hydrolase [Chlorobiaceae bacterium]
MEVRIKRLFRQSAVIPVLDGRVVLITAKKSDRWIIPKGHVQKGLSPADSAAKEAFEEAGLIGVVHQQQAGQFGYRKFGKHFSVEVYPLYINTMLEEWDEMHDRQRKLVTPAEAIEMVWHDDLRRIISDFFAVN